MNDDSDQLMLAACQVDLRARKVWLEGREERLSAREAELLRFLAGSTKAVSRESIERQVWKMAPGVVSDAVPVAIRRLRRRIERDPKQPESLLTEYGVGWRLLVRTPSRPVVGGANRPKLIGRDEMVQGVNEGWDVTRIQTLIGPGGVGKTAVAKACLPEGGLFVDLCSAVDRVTVMDALQAATRTPFVPHPDWRRLLRQVRSETDFLILDNAEQCVDAVAEVAEAWVELDANVLVTSRVPLEVTEERRVYVRPLAESEARQLFLTRFASSGGTHSLDSDEVDDLLSDLDGLPLAIELVAPRARVLPMKELSPAHGLQTLIRARGVPRHRGIQACIEWSWALLSPADQEAMRYLSCFAGVFTLDDIKAFAFEETDHLSTLVHHSLVQVDGPGQFRLLELIQRFCRETTDAQHVDTHATHVLERLQRVPPGPDRTRHLVTVARDLKTILMRSTSGPLTTAAGEALHEHWRLTGGPRDRRMWEVPRRRLSKGEDYWLQTLRLALSIVLEEPDEARALLDEVPDATDDIVSVKWRVRFQLDTLTPAQIEAWMAHQRRAKASFYTRAASYHLAFSYGRVDPHNAMQFALWYVAEVESNGPSLALFDGYTVLTGLSTACQRVAEAIEYAERTVTIARDLGSARMAARAVHLLAVVSAGRDRIAAQAMFVRAARELETFGPETFSANAHSNLGVNSWFLGDYELALTHLERACEIRRDFYSDAFLALARHWAQPASEAVREALGHLADGGRPMLAELLAILTFPDEPGRPIDEILEPLAPGEMRADLTTAVELVRIQRGAS